MVVANDSSYAFPGLVSIVQKSVCFILRIMPRFLTTPIVAVVGAIYHSVLYAARFFRDKLEADPLFKARLLKAGGNDNNENTVERANDKSIFGRIVTFFFCLGSSIAKGVKLGLMASQGRSSIDAELQVDKKAPQCKGRHKMLDNTRSQVYHRVEQKKSMNKGLGDASDPGERNRAALRGSQSG